MSRSTRVRELLLERWRRLRSNLLWATVRKVRPSVSKWATVGVSACTAAFSAAALLLRAYRAG